MAKKQAKPKIIYYHDELNDEFSGDDITARKIDADYQYICGGIRGKLLRLFWYRIFIIPIAWVYMKLKFGHRIIGRRKLKKSRKTGFFMYGNHTQNLADAFIPTMVTLPRGIFVIVHPNNVSMPYLGRVTPYMGALPLPDDAAAGKHFVEAIKTHTDRGRSIMVYPEAHIWPYYTDIRPFTDASFRYPVNYHKPVYCLTNTYRKRRFRKTPRIVTYIDGPFAADEALPGKEQRKALRDQVYGQMKRRAGENTVCVIQYIKADTEREA